ncbi:MAG: alcohol dehydrogenase catalytic domain-containing protein [Desulfobacterales bacterium]|nr:alcohol dehydrogenase catalytic domain-containing protein [Desulfobacterales bacterium]
MQALQFNVSTPRYIAAKSLKPFLGDRVFFKGPAKTTRLVEIPEPQLPSQEWVKIQTLYCGFCGSDLNLMRLHDSPTASPFTSFPCIAGHEIVGKVAATGERVDGFADGDVVAVNPALSCEARSINDQCVACASGRPSNCENFARGSLPPGMFTGINRGVNGGFTPFLVAHHSQLFKIPARLSLEAAAMTEPVAVALQTVFDNQPMPGETALVIGGGVIGNLVIQSIRTLTPESRIAVIEPARHAAELALKLGADEIIPSKQVFDQSATATGATVYKPMLGDDILMGGFNRIYDTVGNSATLNMSLRLLAVMGTLSVVGIGGEVKLDLTPLWLKLQNVRGVYGYGRVTHDGQERHVFDIALDFMQSGRIDAETLVTHKFKLEDYLDMIAVNMNKGAHKAVKTLVSFV